MLFQLVVIFLTFTANAYAEELAQNIIKFDNQSGRNAVVRIMGPTKTIAKMQRDETRTVRVEPGEYYILVRYGDSEKEYSYTKSAVFSVTQPANQISIITFTLHRRGTGSFHSRPVPGDEFERALSSHPAPSTP